MTTKPTEEDRIQFLNSLKTVIDKIGEELKDTRDKLALTADKQEILFSMWEAAKGEHEKLIREANESVRAIDKKLDEFKDETDRFKKYSSSIDDNLKDRFQIFVEKFNNQGKALELLETSLKGIRELDLDRINEKVKELPSLEVIRKELSRVLRFLCKREIRSVI
ncbi:hypothetical protein [Pseudanabaena sp. PCC 6802]|uniref:hypothetical protein n=1 Tax=Pseudanabaena sp. PCC 6802 TaxID=118173 RepID=UPI00034547ED|nr:hypothetical protein [Pseudanabaena sp. PCC 6802]